MDIAVICDVLGEENNGTTIAAMNLIRTLRAKGHQVRVVSPDANRAGSQGTMWFRPGIWEFSTTMWQKTASVLQSRSVLFWKRLWREWMWCM